MNKEEIQRNRLWNFRQIIKNVGGTNEAARIMSKKTATSPRLPGRVRSAISATGWPG